MKSLTILLLAGLAVAAQEGGAQAAAGNATDVQQGGDAAAEAGNNSTEVNQGADANAEAGKENNNENNNNDEEDNAANEVIQVQNGQQCVNLEAVNDPKCASTLSPSVIIQYQTNMFFIQLRPRLPQPGEHANGWPEPGQH